LFVLKCTQQLQDFLSLAGCSRGPEVRAAQATIGPREQPSRKAIKKNMNTIHCRVKQNEYQDIGKRHVTPAEAVVLRAIHDPAAHTFASQATNPDEIAAYWKVLVNPVASGEAEILEHDGDGKLIGRHKRSNGEELQRLRHLYPVRSKVNPRQHLIDELFPGLNPQLPQTFQDIGLKVAAPEDPKPAASKGHGPEMAVSGGERSVVNYDAAPKEPKAPKAPKAPKEPKAPKAPKGEEAAE
jgi:hypothetical protein